MTRKGSDFSMQVTSLETAFCSQAAAIDRLVIASSRPHDRRDAERHPFFQPVTILAAGKASSHRAFTREISRTGIGLVHDGALDLGEIGLVIHDGSAEPVQLRVELLWCRPSGDGWYISGGRFLTPDQAS